MTQAFINNLADKLQKVGALHAIGETWISIDSTIPAGGVPFLGQLVSRSVWADLFAWATSQGKVKTESEWQSYASANGGNCPFYSDGDGSTTFRMPKVVGYIKGAASQSEAGIYTAEGLPNIEGEMKPVAVGTVGNNIFSANGAFVDNGLSDEDLYASSASYRLHYEKIGIDASKSNPIYGNSSHVTPETHSILIGVYAVGVVANIGSADATQFLNGLATLESEMTTYERVASSASNYVRYESGLQLVFGNADVPGSGSKTITFPVAFSTLKCVLATPKFSYVNVSAATGTMMTIANNYSSSLSISYLTIGLWK